METIVITALLYQLILNVLDKKKDFKQDGNLIDKYVLRDFVHNKSEDEIKQIFADIGILYQPKTNTMNDLLRCIDYVAYMIRSLVYMIVVQDLEKVQNPKIPEVKLPKMTKNIIDSIRNIYRPIVVALFAQADFIISIRHQPAKTTVDIGNDRV